MRGVWELRWCQAPRAVSTLVLPGLCCVEGQQIYPGLGHKAELREDDLGAVSNWEEQEQPSDFSKSWQDIQTSIPPGTEPLLQSVPFPTNFVGCEGTVRSLGVFKEGAKKLLDGQHLEGNLLNRQWCLDMPSFHKNHTHLGQFLYFYG